MGTWGAGLYDDDLAADLKNTIALVCKVPGDGDHLLMYLKQLKQLPGIDDPSDEDAALFWLVVADQFEKRGIACLEARVNALAVIESGLDLVRAKERGADERFLRRRASVLEELAVRLNSPRAPKGRKVGKKAPNMVVQTGEVYAFPTMAGCGRHPYHDVTDGLFVADGWGALIVLGVGRVFDWLPWCALASLTVNPTVKPTLADAVHGRMIFHLQTRGAGRYVPKREHARVLGLELLGQVSLDLELVEPHLSKWPILSAIEFDWSIAYAAYSQTYKGLPMGCELSALVKRA